MRLSLFFFFFFFNDTATTEIYTLPLHDALPILLGDLGVLHDVVQQRRHHRLRIELPVGDDLRDRHRMRDVGMAAQRSEEHTSELQSPCNLVCRLLLEKKKTTRRDSSPIQHATVS